MCYSAQKGGFMRDAATEGIAILFPDTSPRGAGIEDETAAWDFGVGKSGDHAGGAKQYRSCSAFSPICEPSAVPWGQKAFRGYLAGGVEEGKANYDASVLVGKVKGAINILIDYVRIFLIPALSGAPCGRAYTDSSIQGTADTFLYQLHPEVFLKAARDAGHDEVQVRVRCHEGYDHSYYFISSFASDHIHCKYFVGVLGGMTELVIMSIVHANFLKA
ncbi:carbohydrate esterase family 1 protein [Boletus reticuloceps]|uniref:Carbohydrate esterase family 1 protein n=1 Tax=Boletus reticuloceps TaxID=495285 RepID=A0A8I2YX07_9AGAM|nr:carbohydrate esterase family 1 protein [Boletus reticuloceps]